MTTWDVLLRYTEVARPIIREYFRADSCIASTAITIEVMKRLGIVATPYPCRVLVFNAPFMSRVKRERRYPDSTEVIKWTTGTNLWSVGVGYTTNNEPHVGHLIAIVENKYLVDASIDQASRPHKGILLPPVMIGAVSRDFRRFKKGSKFEIEGPDGTLVTYRPDHHTHNLYLKSTNWTDKALLAPAVTRITAELSMQYMPHIRS
jgi:hypothetical protein